MGALLNGGRVHHASGIDAGGASEEAQKTIEVGCGQCTGQPSRSAQGEIRPDPRVALHERFGEHPAAETSKGGGSSSQRGRESPADFWVSRKKIRDSRSISATSTHGPMCRSKLERSPS